MSIKVNHTVLGEGLPKICVPLTGKTKEQLTEQARAARQAEPDLVEWRVDHLEWLQEYLQDDVQEALQNEAEHPAGNREAIRDHAKNIQAELRAMIHDTAKVIQEELSGIPLLFTCRTADEGGVCAITAEQYRTLNLAAADCGEVSLIDVEIYKKDLDVKALIGQLQAKKKVTIASNHHFHETPADAEMEKIFAAMREADADIWKLAVMPRQAEDVLRLLAVTQKISSGTDHPVITMSMGQLGAISRMAGSLVGSAVTFASVTEASAPGQVAIQTMKEILHVLG